MKICLSLTTYRNGLALDICKLSITHMQSRWVGVKVNIVPTERPRQKDETPNNLSSLSICHCYIFLSSSKSTPNEEISQVPRKGRSTMSFPIPAALAPTFSTPSLITPPLRPIQSSSPHYILRPLTQAAPTKPKATLTSKRPIIIRPETFNT